MIKCGRHWHDQHPPSIVLCLKGKKGVELVCRNEMKEFELRQIIYRNYARGCFLRRIETVQ